jgi:hypothetical protein
MKEFRDSFVRNREEGSTADYRSFTLPIWCYRGNIANPMWEDVDTGESSFV